MRTVTVALVFSLSACSEGTVDSSSLDTGTDAASDLGEIFDSAPEVADTLPDVVAPFVPTSVNAELVFSGPSRQKTPPTWNAHLPKLVGDDAFLYAVHTHFTEDTSS